MRTHLKSALLSSSHISSTSSSLIIPRVYGETLSPQVFVKFIIKRREWFAQFEQRISHYFKEFDYCILKQKSQPPLADDINEFFNKITNTNKVFGLFKMHFYTDANFKSYCDLGYDFIYKVRDYLTDDMNGVRFQKFMMHQLSPEEYNDTMRSVGLPVVDATVEQGQVSFKLK